MNASRTHTDGERHDGDTTRISREIPDPSFMSPELLAEKLRKVYGKHWCRSIGCDNAVNHCGDTCPRCTSEIEALRKHYEAQDRKATLVFWPALVLVAMMLCALFLAAWGAGQLLRGIL
jgi:hypothetical protein